MTTSSFKAGDLLACRGDVYNGVTIKSEASIATDFNSKIPTVEEAKRKLQNSLEHWSATGIGGVWFEVSLQVRFFCSILEKLYDILACILGADPFRKWFCISSLATRRGHNDKMAARRSSIFSAKVRSPASSLAYALICTACRYPFTNLGVGGVVENAKGEILLMRERRGRYLGWKFPGNFDEKHNFVEAFTN